MRKPTNCFLGSYDVALVYLDQADYNLEIAIEAFKEDERWEKEHPMEANVKGKGKGKKQTGIGRRRLTGQRS